MTGGFLPYVNVGGMKIAPLRLDSTTSYAGSFDSTTFGYIVASGPGLSFVIELLPVRVTKSNNVEAKDPEVMPLSIRAEARSKSLLGLVDPLDEE
jgi:hypothetical protein